MRHKILLALLLSGVVSAQVELGAPHYNRVYVHQTAASASASYCLNFDGTGLYEDQNCNGTKDGSDGYLSAGASLSLGNLSDVTLASLADADILAYDANTGAWYNLGASAASDVSVTNATTTEITFELKADVVGNNELDNDATFTLTGLFDLTGGELRIPFGAFASIPGSPAEGELYVSNDATDSSTCDGGGTADALCYYNGGWIALSGGSGGSGDVVGPAGATDTAVARYSTTTGKLLQDSAVLISAGAMTGVASIAVSGNVDGRDVSVDGAKLDGIGAGADVTDVGDCDGPACFTATGDGTSLFTNTDFIIELDNNNDSLSELQVKNGGNSVVFRVDESGQITIGSSTVSATGGVKFANQGSICWRDAGDSADLCISVTATDYLDLDMNLGFNTAIADPAPVTAGVCAWSTDNNWLACGDGAAGTVELPNVVTRTDEYLCTWEDDGTAIECDVDPASVGGSGAFDDASDPVVLNTTTKQVIVGPTPTNQGKLSVVGDADERQVVIEANAPQNTSILLVESAGGTTDYFSIGGAGKVTVFTEVDLPSDATPTTDGVGEIALDTTIVDHQPMWQYYDGAENMTVIAIDTAELPALDNEIVKYNASIDKFVLEADAGGSSVWSEGSVGVYPNTSAMHICDVTDCTGDYEIQDTGEASFTSLTVDAVAAPTITFDDSDTTVETSDATIIANATVATTGSEDVDVTFATQMNSVATDYLTADASAAVLYSNINFGFNGEDAPGPQLEGVCAWDNTEDWLTCGDGNTNTVEFVHVNTKTNTNLCTYDDTNKEIDCGTPTSTFLTAFTDIDTDYGDETVDGSDWIFNPNATGANGTYDLTVGTAGGYGALNVGGFGLYTSSFSASGMNLDKAVLFRQEGTLGASNDPGIEFAWMEGANTVRLAIPESASGNATAFIRSGTFAGPYSSGIGNDIVLCDQWTTYNANLDCDTSGTGADVLIQDDLEMGSNIFFNGDIDDAGSLYFDADDANQLRVGAVSQSASHSFLYPDDEIVSADLMIGNAAGTFIYAPMSVDATMTNAGVVTVTDDSHNHVITNIDLFTKAQLETQTSDVSNYAEADGDIYTNAHDFSTASSIEVENNGTVALGAGGHVGVDTTCTACDTAVGQFRFHDGTASRVIAHEYQACATLETLVDGDDGVPIFPASEDITITAVGCHVTGTSANATFQDNAASPNVIEASVACEAGATVMAWITTLDNTSIIIGEFVEFDTVGTSPVSPGFMTACVKYTVDAR